MRWFIVVFILLHTVLWYHHLGSMFFNTTELGDLTVTATRPLEPAFILTGEPHPPLWYVFLHIWSGVFGIGPLVSRIPALFFSICLIFLLYRYLPASQRFFSTLLISISPFLLLWSRTAEKDTLFIFLTFALYASFVRRKHFLFFLLLLATMQTHFYSMYLIAVIWVYLLLKRDARLMKYSLFFIAGFLAYAPQFFMGLEDGFLAPPFDEPEYDMLPAEGHFFNSVYLYMYEKGMDWYGLGMLVLFYGVFFTRKRSLFAKLFFLGIPLIIFVQSFFMFVQFYQFLFMLPFYIVFFIRYASRLRIAPLLIIAFVVLSVAGIPSTLAHKTKIDFADFAGEQNTLVVVNGYTGLTLGYYSDAKYIALHYPDFMHLADLQEENIVVYYSVEVRYVDENFFEGQIFDYLKEHCNEMDYSGMYFCSRITE
ncbi:glycosyltransferase family 39 protein [Candidatus Woesearchaeota archaeon]|nr:glycosyltransferase family 39 protein [Candidatus Woesearchaeota archaeon]